MLAKKFILTPHKFFFTDIFNLNTEFPSSLIDTTYRQTATLPTAILIVSKALKTLKMHLSTIIMFKLNKFKNILD